MDKFKNLSPQLCLDRLFQTATYEGLQAGISDESNILVKDYGRGKFTNYKNAGSMTDGEKQKIFGYGKIDIQAALQDMDDTQLAVLQTFSDNRRNDIVNISTLNRDKTKKFMNSLYKERILH